MFNKFKRPAIMIAIVIGVMWAGIASSQYAAKIYKPGPDELVVADGGKITIESGGEIEFASGAALDVQGGTTFNATAIDASSATAMLIGAATATSVEIADTLIATDIKGTLSVDEAAVFDTTLGVTGHSTLASVGVTGAATVGTTLVVTGATTLNDAVTVAEDVFASSDATGGNALAKNEFIGLPRIKNVPLSTMADGTTNTVIVDIGDSETPATDWTAVDADTVMSNDGIYYRQGTASLKMAIAGTATEDDGCTNTLGTGDQDWSDDEAFGFWMYSDAAMAGGILQLVVSDSVAVDVKFAVPAYATPDVWQWMEIDITTATTNVDVLEDVSITLTATGEAQAGVAAWNVYFDFFVKWDVAEEETLGVAIPYDGVLTVTTIDVTSGGAAMANLAEYTDYFVHYQSGNDAIVIITDQNDTDVLGLALVAYQ